MQLIGRNEPEQGALDLDLGTLQARGVRLLGRLHDIVGATARFRPDLRDSVAAADARMGRLLDSVDDYVNHAGLRAEVWPGKRPRPVAVPAAPERLDLRAERIGTIVLAAGYRPHHPWLRLPIISPDGYIRQYRGVTPAPGVYVVGQRFQHRRDSSFIDGARHDAAAVVEHLIGSRPRSAAVTGEEASS